MGVSPKNDNIIKNEEKQSEAGNINTEGLTKAQKKNLKKKLKKQKQKEVGLQSVTSTERELSTHPTVEELFNMQKGKIVFNRGEKLKLPLNVKIADLGNACWKHHHFST